MLNFPGSWEPKKPYKYIERNVQDFFLFDDCVWKIINPSPINARILTIGKEKRRCSQVIRGPRFQRKCFRFLFLLLLSPPHSLTGYRDRFRLINETISSLLFFSGGLKINISENLCMHRRKQKKSVQSFYYKLGGFFLFFLFQGFL